MWTYSAPSTGIDCNGVKALTFRNFSLMRLAAYMFRSRTRRALPLLAMLLFVVVGCSDKDEDSGGGNPGGPSPTPPPSGVVSIAGTWNGTSDVQQNGQRFVSNLTATFRQTDRAIEGTILFTSSGWSGWQATFTGQLSGNSPESQFFGNVTINAAPTARLSKRSDR